MKSRLPILLLILMVGMIPSHAFGAEKVYNLVWENFSTPKHRTSVIGQKFGDAVMAQSNGRIKISYHYGEPVPNRELLDAVGAGTLDVINATLTYYSGKVGIADFTLMPSNFRTWQDMYDLFVNTELWNVVDQVYRKAANCTVIFPFSIFAPEDFQIGKKTKKIRLLEDFKGLKIRAAGGAPGMTVKLLGAVPVTLIAGEYYTGMQRGTIDGGLMTMYALETYKMWEVCHQQVGPPIFPACTIFAMMNLKVWDSLPKDLQEMIRRVARDPKLFQEAVKFVDGEDERIKKIAMEKYGVEFYELPKEEAEKMYKTVDPVWDWYVDNCTKQGFGSEAKKVREIIQGRFYRK